MGLAIAGVVELGAHALASGRERRTAIAKRVAGAALPAVADRQPVRVPPLFRKKPDVEQAIKAGVRDLKEKQQVNGSWADIDTGHAPA